MSRQCRLTINLDNLAANYQLAVDAAPGSNTLAVIKANAYGHGMAEVASKLTNAPAYAVATIDEGLCLRAITDKPILILQGVLRQDELVEATHRRLTLMVQSQEQLALLKEQPLHQPIHAWVKADTGMHRLGIPVEEVESTIEQLQQLTWVDDQLVVCSHFANASDPVHALNAKQWERFTELRLKLSSNIDFSMANSAGILSGDRYHLEWNRPGIMLYGGSPFDDIHHKASSQLKPVMQFTTEVIGLRDLAPGESVGYGSTWTAEKPARIATLAVGYADGYPRHAANGTPVAINGQIYPLAGRVSMDMITVDITGQESVAIGDKAELWGELVNINEVAEKSGTISYELMTKITNRVKRDYLGSDPS